MQARHKLGKTGRRFLLSRDFLGWSHSQISTQRIEEEEEKTILQLGSIDSEKRAC